MRRTNEYCPDHRDGDLHVGEEKAGGRAGQRKAAGD